MDLKEFGEKVAADPILDMAYVDVVNRFVIVRNTNSTAFFKLLVDAVYVHTERELFGYMHGTLDPHPLRQYARIVGYYSDPALWNKSKLAELADRHKGDYGVGESWKKGDSHGG